MYKITDETSKHSKKISFTRKPYHEGGRVIIVKTTTPMTEVWRRRVPV